MQNADPYNRGGFIAFVFSMAFSLLFFVYLVVVHPGIDLREVSEEGAETTLAEAPTTGAVDVSNVEKPWAPSEDLIVHGKQVYQQNCLVCHGAEGRGDGPAGKSLVPPPRDLVEGSWTKGGSSKDLFQTISNGIPGTSMVGFGHLPVVDRWAMVHYIRSITKNKVEDNEQELEEFAKQVK